MSEAHEHRMAHATRTTAPVRDGGYTEFFVMHCAGCGLVQVFPELNFRLVTPEYRRDFEAELKARGRFLDLETRDGEAG
jgi:hypothetical protein